MRRFLAAAALTGACLCLVVFSCLWVESRLTLWDELLARAEQAALQNDTETASRLIDELNRSLQENSPGLSLFFRKDIAAALKGQFCGLAVYLSPDTPEDLHNAVYQSQVQLDLLRELFFGVF